MSPLDRLLPPSVRHDLALLRAGLLARVRPRVRPPGTAAEIHARDADFPDLPPDDPATDWELAGDRITIPRTGRWEITTGPEGLRAREVRPGGEDQPS